MRHFSFVCQESVEKIMANDGSAIQTYAIVPHVKWKAMEQRLQRAEPEVNSEVQEPPAI